MNIRIPLTQILLIAILSGQNFQLHYDFGEDRKYCTSTLEMFKPDKYGATFWFVDFDYNSYDHYASLAYFELARYISLPFFNNLSATVQFNDGLLIFDNPDQDSFMQYAGNNIGQTWLAGINFPLSLSGNIISTDILLRFRDDFSSRDIQVTGVWLKSWLNNKIDFTGYYDIWTKSNEQDEKELVYLSKPQIWYNVNRHLSLGTEVEFSKNFIPGSSGVKINPTIAFKWIF